MTINPLAKKLGLRPGMRALIIAAPPGYLKLIAPLPEGASVSLVANGTHPFIQFFAARASEVKKSASKLLKHAATGALVWIAYPKKTSGVDSDLSREAVRDAMRDTGWRPVAIVSIDEVWSTLRFRPTKDVKSRRVK
jgi:predicted SnoaL-like aldol condensation-catalyzing enzyme